MFSCSPYTIPHLSINCLTASISAGPLRLRLDLESGEARLEDALKHGGIPQSRREGWAFLRVYTPALRWLMIGSSPIAVKLAELSAAMGH
jgi:hypothetical protein